MVRIYARENATQRGNTGTALAGSIAAAIKDLAREEMLGTGGITSANIGGQARDGIGRDRILEALKGVPGITEHVIQQQLANLKASGDYDRIVSEIVAEAETANKAAVEALERAEAERIEAKRRATEADEARKAAQKAEQEAREKARAAAAELKAAKDVERELARKRVEEAAARRTVAEANRKQAELERKQAEAKRKAAEAEEKKHEKARAARDAVDKAKTAPKHDITFDFSGVAQHFTNSSHIERFRKLVTGAALREMLPVNQQAALAASLVAEAKKRGVELTAAFIHEEVNNQLISVRDKERTLKDDDRQKLLRQDWEAKAKALQEHFSRQCRGMLSDAHQLSDHTKKRPRGVSFYVTSEFRSAVDNAEKAVALIRKELII
jgi:hypothetical protein